jgi:hypothetical protein
VPVDRPVMIDAHMHIQSRQLRPAAADPRPHPAAQPGPRHDELAGGTWVLKTFATGDLGDMSPLPTQEIGARLVALNDDLGTQMWQVCRPYFLGMSVVLTMDMDYVHLDGYDGLHIYQEDDKGRYYYKRTAANTPREELKKKYLDELEDLPMDVEEGEDAAALRRQNADLDKYLADAASNCYETWKQQRRRTEMADGARPAAPAADVPLRAAALHQGRGQSGAVRQPGRERWFLHRLQDVHLAGLHAGRVDRRRARRRGT